MNNNKNLLIFLIIMFFIVVGTAMHITKNTESTIKKCESVGGEVVTFKNGSRCVNPDIFIDISN